MPENAERSSHSGSLKQETARICGLINGTYSYQRIKNQAHADKRRNVSLQREYKGNSERDNGRRQK